jgi:hypothetical protein
MAQGFLIGENLLGQIKDTVKRVQGEPMVGNISRIETRFEGGPVAVTSKTFRICTFTGAWAINGEKTVTFKNQTATPNTVAAVNLFCGLDPGGSCDVSIAKEGTAWYLVQPNLTQLPGYSASGTQVMVIVSGNLRFIGTTAC